MEYETYFDDEPRKTEEAATALEKVVNKINKYEPENKPTNENN